MKDLRQPVHLAISRVLARRHDAVAQAALGLALVPTVLSLLRALDRLPVDTPQHFGLAGAIALAVGVMTLVCAAVLLGLSALLAAWLPAQRAARTDPRVALRNE